MDISIGESNDMKGTEKANNSIQVSFRESVLICDWNTKGIIKNTTKNT